MRILIGLFFAILPVGVFADDTSPLLPMPEAVSPVDHPYNILGVSLVRFTRLIIAT